jgi:hypothetical protein
MKAGAVIFCLALSGCASTGGQNVKWYNPGTWFSGAAGREVAKVEAKIDKVSDSALTEANRAVHATNDALNLAPKSRAVDVAKANNDNAVALLDQLSGPLSAADAALLKERVRLLVSDVAEERARGEAMQLDAQKKLDAVSSELSKLTEDKKRADADLAKSFGRENALANELRNEQWWSWFWRISIGLAALLFLGGWVYVRFTIGGLPTALGRSLAQLRATDPATADKLTSTLDIHTSPAEQTLIRLLTAKLHP